MLYKAIFNKNSSKSESRNHPYRGPARRPSPEYSIPERVYPGLPSYEARPSENRFSDVSTTSSDFDLAGLTRGNEVPITKNKRYFTLQKAKKSNTGASGIPRVLKTKVSFKRAADWYRRDMPDSDEAYP